MTKVAFVPVDVEMVLMWPGAYWLAGYYRLAGYCPWVAVAQVALLKGEDYVRKLFSLISNGNRVCKGEGPGIGWCSR